MWTKTVTEAPSVWSWILVLLVNLGCSGMVQPGGTCQGAACSQACTETKECPVGQDCVDRRCQRERPCQTDADCAQGFHCVPPGCYPTECAAGASRPCQNACGGTGTEQCEGTVWRGCTAPPCLPDGGVDRSRDANTDRGDASACRDPDEPNDICDQARAVTANGTGIPVAINATIDSDLDLRDLFRVTASGNGDLILSLSRIPAGTDYNLYLFDACAAGLTNRLASSDQSGNVDEYIDYAPVAGQEYIVEVTAFSYARPTQPRTSSCDFYILEFQGIQ
jgi:hypothetical protein